MDTQVDNAVGRTRSRSDSESVVRSLESIADARDQNLPDRIGVAIFFEDQQSCAPSCDDDRSVVRDHDPLGLASHDHLETA